MQYILDCVTLLLNVVLCFYLLYGKYPVRSTHMVKRILLITAAVISKALIVYLQISPLNFISGCCIIYVYSVICNAHIKCRCTGCYCCISISPKYNFNNIRNYSACLATSYLELDSPDRPYKNCKDFDSFQGTI